MAATTSIRRHHRRHHGEPHGQPERRPKAAASPTPRAWAAGGGPGAGGPPPAGSIITIASGARSGTVSAARPARGRVSGQQHGEPQHHWRQRRQLREPAVSTVAATTSISDTTDATQW
ncbi:MAG: hypothetical protein IPN05_19920 [Sulfuritalea sp.]|nr:hypothetical protein [Sulfuritalea sp.]